MLDGSYGYDDGPQSETTKAIEINIPKTAFMAFHALLILAAVILVFVMKDDNTFTMVVNFAVAGVILLFIAMLYIFRNPPNAFFTLILAAVAAMNLTVAVFKLVKKDLFDKSVVDTVLVVANILVIIIMAANSRVVANPIFV